MEKETERLKAVLTEEAIHAGGRRLKDDLKPVRRV